MSTSAASTKDPAEEAMSPAKTAARMGVQVATLATWRSRGQGPAYVKLGRIIRYLPRDVEAWMEAQRHDPEAAN